MEGAVQCSAQALSLKGLLASGSPNLSVKIFLILSVYHTNFNHKGHM